MYKKVFLILFFSCFTFSMRGVESFELKLIKIQEAFRGRQQEQYKKLIKEAAVLYAPWAHSMGYYPTNTSLTIPYFLGGQPRRDLEAAIFDEFSPNYKK